MKPSLSKLLQALLRKSDIRVDPLRTEEILSRHPLPHSIRSLSDTLDELHVPNMVCRLEFEQLFEIEGPFIAVAGREEYPFHLVEKVDNARRTVRLRTFTGKNAELPFERFRQAWDGTVLLAEKGERAEQKSRPIHWLKTGLWRMDLTAKYWVAALVVMLLGWGILRHPEPSDWRYLIKGIGLSISLLIILKTFFDPHLAEKFCRTGRNSGCNKVFNTSAARPFGWASLGELSLAYFAASLLGGLFFAANPGAMFLLPDTLALLIAAISLAWQIIHRKWCTLCLAIDAVLVADFLGETLLWGGFGNFRSTVFSDTVVFGLLFVLCLLTLRILIRMAKLNRESRRIFFNHESLLCSPEIFGLLLTRQPAVTEGAHTVPTVGNRLEAEHKLTVVMNPSCPKCAAVHRTIRSLEDYRIELIFVVNEGDRKSYDAALGMISSGITDGWSRTEELIAGWYERHELPADLTIHPQAEAHLAAQMAYCQRIGITGTPTILIDNRQLPEIYDAEDLKVLL